MEIAGPAIGLGIAYALIEVLKLAISKIGRNGNSANSANSAKMLARIDTRTDYLWEAHKPVDGRYQWWLPADFSEKQDQMLSELRTMNGHLKTISNGGTKGKMG